MKIACLSDVHANLPALQRAMQLARERGAERLIVAGDLVGDGPFPVETLATLRESEDTQMIRGNVDRKVLAKAKLKKKKLKKRLERSSPKKQNRVWTALALGKEDRKWLRSLPTQLELTIGGHRILVVHGSPRGDTDYLYSSLTADGLEAKLAEHEGPHPAVLVSGHSHVPFTKRVAGTLVVNCGSVGRPSDGDPRGSFALLDLGGEQPQAEIVRFEYPVGEVCETLQSRDVPGVDPRDYAIGVKS